MITLCPPSPQSLVKFGPRTGWYLCCKLVGGKADLGSLGYESPSLGDESPTVESRSESLVEGLRGRSPPEAEEYSLNLIKKFTFRRIKCSFYCDFVIMSITTLIKFELTLLTRLASGCCRCVSVCASRVAV